LADSINGRKATLRLIRRFMKQLFSQEPQRNSFWFKLYVGSSSNSPQLNLFWFQNEWYIHVPGGERIAMWIGETYSILGVSGKIHSINGACIRKYTPYIVHQNSWHKMTQGLRRHDIRHDIRHSIQLLKVSFGHSFLCWKYFERYHWKCKLTSQEKLC
jgi:hypothetical protein